MQQHDYPGRPQGGYEGDNESGNYGQRSPRESQHQQRTYGTGQFGSRDYGGGQQSGGNFGRNVSGDQQRFQGPHGGSGRWSSQQEQFRGRSYEQDTYGSQLGRGDDGRQGYDSYARPGGQYEQFGGPTSGGTGDTYSPPYEQSGRFTQPGRHGQSHDQDFDPDYHQWRNEQMQSLDEDYRSWRQDRYKKFSDEFNTWRSNRSRAGSNAGGSEATVSEGGQTAAASKGTASAAGTKS